MRCFLLATLAVVGCGSVNTRHEQDAAVADTQPSPDAAVDAANVTCTFVPSTSTSQSLAYTFAGGSFQSYGCAPIDPTYWLAGTGMSVTVTFVAPQARPSIRVWGMNTDDTASLTVNGAAYPLTTVTASLTPKVVCGLSPGPDGVAFVNNLLTGANTPAAGNYSYQDVTVEMSGVSSILITGQSGAGWGFAGASVCAPAGPI
jgi:hypothetical protein